MDATRKRHALRRLDQLQKEAEEEVADGWCGSNQNMDLNQNRQEIIGKL
jgi:hypothetical protein